MRVLHISEVGWGGVVSLIRQFTAEQNSRGHTVAMLAPAISPSLPDITHMKWSLQRSKPSTYLVAYREMLKAIDDFKPDVIHLHSFMAGFIGRLPLKTGSSPVVYQPHAWSFELREGRSFRKALELWERFAGRRTRVMVTNCQDEIDEGHSAGVTTDGAVIGVAVDTDRFVQVDEDERQRYRAELGVQAPRMLLCIGRLVRQKGQDLLVAAWEEQPVPDTELVLVGPGDTEALRALAPTQWGRSIRAVGEDTDVRRWLWACDALVLSSRYETVAVVVAEALSVGRPVIATDVNGAGEVINGGTLPAAGRVVPIGDMGALLEESAQVLGDPELVAQMSEAGRIRAESLFSARAVVDRLDAAYEKAIDKPAKVPRQRPADSSTTAQPAGSRHF